MLIWSAAFSVKFSLSPFVMVSVLSYSMVIFAFIYAGLSLFAIRGAQEDALYSRRCWLVYQLLSNWCLSVKTLFEFKSVILDQNNLQFFFKDDHIRVKTFRKFLAQGCRDIAWHIR